jgi:hypothetical protein
VAVFAVIKDPGETRDDNCFSIREYLENASGIQKKLSFFGPKIEENPHMSIYANDFIYAHKCKHKNKYLQWKIISYKPGRHVFGRNSVRKGSVTGIVHLFVFLYFSFHTKCHACYY